ncbi:MAG: hypothetical protein ABIO44_11665, partial [Saprospiraceae bacterium]
ARKNFESELARNSELSKEVELYNKLLELKDTYGSSKAQNMVNMVFANSGTNQKNPSEVKSSSNVWAFAAVLIALITAAFFLFSPKSHTLPDIAQMRLERTELSLTIDKLGAASFSSSEKGKDDSLAAALSLYKAFEYTKSRMALLQYLSVYPTDLIASLYLGLSYLQNAEYAKAAKYLTPLTRAEGFEFKNTAKWYSSMCYTQFGGDDNIKTAKVLLKELADDVSSDYSDYAKAYLDLLR